MQKIDLSLKQALATSLNDSYYLDALSLDAFDCTFLGRNRLHRCERTCRE